MLTPSQRVQIQAVSGVAPATIRKWEKRLPVNDATEVRIARALEQLGLTPEQARSEARS